MASKATAAVLIVRKASSALGCVSFTSRKASSSASVMASKPTAAVSIARKASSSVGGVSSTSRKASSSAGGVSSLPHCDSLLSAAEAYK